MNPSIPEKTTLPWPKEKISKDHHQSTNNYWIIPFVMAGVNYKVVRWAHSLRQQGCTDMIYREAMLVNDFQSAITMYSGIVMFGSMFFNPITAYFVKNYLIPKPGEGPSMETMEKKSTSFFCIIVGNIFVVYLLYDCFSLYEK